MSATPSETVREARRRFFLANDFGDDGGYDAPWADATFGSLAYRVPNFPARARALRIHDLHHLATGYPTDWRGEAAISAWELGSGWGRHPYAWIIALFGWLTGLLAQPGATWRAFLRGLRSENLYREREIEPWLDRPRRELELAVHAPPRDAALAGTALDAARFAAISILAVGFGLVAITFVAAFVALGAARRWQASFPCPLCAA